MKDSDKTLRERVSRAWQNGSRHEAPPFADAWQAAAARHAAARRRYRRVAGVAVAAAAITIAISLPTTPSDDYILPVDLLETTYWTAPSDVLLPDREFDIYQEIPELFESTQPVEGALL